MCNLQMNGYYDVMFFKELYVMNIMVLLIIVEERQLKFGDEEVNSLDGLDISFFNCGQCGRLFVQCLVFQIYVCFNRFYKFYYCGYCNQFFDNLNELCMYVVIYVGEKLFKCGYCD